MRLTLCQKSKFSFPWKWWVSITHSETRSARFPECDAPVICLSGKMAFNEKCYFSWQFNNPLSAFPLDKHCIPLCARNMYAHFLFVIYSTKIRPILKGQDLVKITTNLSVQFSPCHYLYSCWSVGDGPCYSFSTVSANMNFTKMQIPAQYYYESSIYLVDLPVSPKRVQGTLGVGLWTTVALWSLAFNSSDLPSTFLLDI